MLHVYYMYVANPSNLTNVFVVNIHVHVRNCMVSYLYFQPYDSFFLTSCSTLMVATSKDMLHNDEEVTKRKTNVSRQVKRRAEELGLAKVLSKEFIDVNATVDDDNMKVRSEFLLFVRIIILL